LEKIQVPFRVESQRNVLEDPQIKNLVTLLRFLNDLTSEEKLFEVLHADFLGVPTVDLYKLFSQPAKQRKVFLSAIETKSLFPGIKDHFSNFLRWQKLSKNVNLTEFFETVVRESDFLGYLLSQPDSAVRLNRLDGLFSEIKNLVQHHKSFGLADLIGYFDTLEKHGVAIKEKPLPGIRQAVRLMTAHGAKGLEFDHVFITNLFDGHWGNRRIPQLIKLPDLLESSSHEKIDDERRLFYVAMTRARKMAYLSYPIIGRERRELLPSQFLGEIKPELKEIGLAEEYEKKLDADQSALYQPRTPQNFSVLDKEYLNTLFFKRGLSATAINNYLQCPWRYFYSSLLKIPKAKNKHQMYGTAVHAGLKDFFDHLKREEGISKEILLARFAEALKKEPLTEKDFGESLDKGRGSLGAYFDYYQNSWRTETINEFRVHNVMFKLSEGEVKLTGSLDKIEQIDENGEVNVVDYKTGRPKTRNELEGKTQSATGDYKRQLVFYKLLLDDLSTQAGHPTAKLKMVSGEIDFVEPDQKGNFHKEKFLISDEDVQNLRETIADISDQILNLKFKDKTCGDRDCEYCILREKIV
ncbi:MAG: PD-(D/E)XK nuclease family protein, partial [bacterium]|nr:PD-(D/E)XK nuclease family protein [bacterium]